MQGQIIFQVVTQGMTIAYEPGVRGDSLPFPAQTDAQTPS